MPIFREIWGRVGARGGIVALVRGAAVTHRRFRKNGRLGNLTVPDGAGGELPPMRTLAQKLAERLRVSADDYMGDDARHQVVCRSIQRGGPREEVYPRIPTLLKELAPTVPPILCDVARSRYFNVFVTMIFDSLLA